jgi:5'-nucleotidase
MFPVTHRRCGKAQPLISLLVGCLLLAVSNTSVAQGGNYRILLSNDDGIGSPLLHALHKELAVLPGVEVLVSAPNENKSGSSQSSNAAIDVEPYYSDGEFFGYAVHGAPADSVRFAVVKFGRDTEFDLVVSGINRGANVGNVSHLSGTVGAAMEGIYHGIPAIAISQDVEGVDTTASAKFAAQLVQRYQRTGAPKGTVISINIPRGELRGVAVRPMGDSYLSTASYQATATQGELTSYKRERAIIQSTDDSTDTYAYQQGYISVTPLKFDWTDFEMLDELQSWNLQLAD